MDADALLRKVLSLTLTIDDSRFCLLHDGVETLWCEMTQTGEARLPMFVVAQLRASIEANKQTAARISRVDRRIGELALLYGRARCWYKALAAMRGLRFIQEDSDEWCAVEKLAAFFR